MRDDNIMTVKACAEFLQKSEKTIRLYVSDRSIPFYKKNGSIYFFRTDIIKWIRNGRKK